ncbi:MAG: hypothetical protein A4E70_00818 [Syntrophus sp. PtaU1.Bin005]|jgi:hypothetical protein|nr:MAG: hypothetical protein A4E69_00792 [Syntrophus sp. PtaB.Bin138]OPY82271.1 MAG: hypothetical protein A4E70_00818 [Syntrophus sp. PtaU1.Bin005]
MKFRAEEPREGSVTSKRFIPGLPSPAENKEAILQGNDRATFRAGGLSRINQNCLDLGNGFMSMKVTLPLCDPADA